VQLGFPVQALEFPSGDTGEVRVIAPGLAFPGLMLHAEMAAAGFLAVQRVEAEQFGKFQEIATRPACSRFWFNSSPEPVTLTFFQNSSRSSGMR